MLCKSELEKSFQYTSSYLLEQHVEISSYSLHNFFESSFSTRGGTIFDIPTYPSWTQKLHLLDVESNT